MNNQFLKGERNYEEEDILQVVQFSRTMLPPPKQPVVIEFSNLSLRKGMLKYYTRKYEVDFERRQFSSGKEDFHN